MVRAERGRVIAAVFLCAALAPAPMAMTHHPFSHHGVVSAQQTIINATEFLMRRKRDVEKPILVVGGSPSVVTAFRETGFKTFGALVDDHPGVTKWHVVANHDALAFKSGIFHITYILAANPPLDTAYDLLKETVRVTMPGGFVVFNEDAYPDWHKMFRLWNWERVPVVFNGYAIWRRPYSQNEMTWFYKNTMKKMGKNVLPFRQAWAMMEGVQHVTERLIRLHEDDKKAINRALPVLFGSAA